MSYKDKSKQPNNTSTDKFILERRPYRMYGRLYYDVEDIPRKPKGYKQFDDDEDYEYTPESSMYYASRPTSGSPKTSVLSSPRISLPVSGSDGLVSLPTSGNVEYRYATPIRSNFRDDSRVVNRSRTSLHTSPSTVGANVNSSLGIASSTGRFRSPVFTEVSHGGRALIGDDMSPSTSHSMSSREDSNIDFRPMATGSMHRQYSTYYDDEVSRPMYTTAAYYRLVDRDRTPSPIRRTGNTSLNVSRSSSPGNNQSTGSLIRSVRARRLNPSAPDFSVEADRLAFGLNDIATALKDRIDKVSKNRK